MAQTLPNAVADLELTLASNVFTGDTTATLSSDDDSDGVDLPNGLYGFTIDKDIRSKKEYILCTVTDTAITAVQSLTKQGANTGSGFTKDHRAGAKVTLTDWVLLKRMLDNLKGTVGFDSGSHLGYDDAPVGLVGNEFATVNYVLSVVNGGTVTFDQQVVTSQQYGETVPNRNVVYFRESGARWWNADADLASTIDRVRLGITLNAGGSAGGTGTIAISGPVSGFTGLTAGAKYYLSNTAGGITTTPGTYSVFLGWALSTTTLLFSHVADTGALQGTVGVPSTTNAFVTEDNLYTGNYDQTQGTQDASEIVGGANTSGNRNRLAQSFIPSRTKIRGVELYKTADTGTFTGTVTVALQADTSGSPSGSNLVSVTLTNAQWLATAVGAFQAVFTAETTLSLGTTYWVVVTTSTADNANHPNLGVNSVGGYTSGSAKYFNVTNSWVSITADLYFKTLNGLSTQMARTSTAGMPPFTGVIYQTVTAGTAVSNTTTETTSISQAIDGSILGVQERGIMARIGITVGLANSAGVSVTTALKLGGITIFSVPIGNGDADAAQTLLAAIEVAVTNNAGVINYRYKIMGGTSFSTVNNTSFTGANIALTGRGTLDLLPGPALPFVVTFDPSAAAAATSGQVNDVLITAI